MKTKLLLCFLLAQTVLAYASYGADRPTTGADRPERLKAYFEKFKSILSKPEHTKTELKKPVYTYPTRITTTYAAGPVCRGNTNLGATNLGATNLGATNLGATNLGATAVLLWSDNNSWTSFGATKPVAGSAVSIPAGVHIILDETPPALGSLSISGTVEFAQKDLNLTAGWIMIMGPSGTLQVGTPATPFVHKASISLNATNQNEDAMGMGMGTRGILVMGGKLELHGVPPTKHYTKLNDHAAKDATTLSLLDAVSWQVNDQIVVATTDYYGAGNGTAQRSQITAINGSSVTIQDGLNAQRWGKLQYLTKDGMSLTPGELPAGISPGTPTVLDERAEVANLTRNIVVESVDDDLWRTNGFGCHIMIMRMNGMTGQARLNGVEIKRGGQAGKLGRYPFHWHMLSYEGSTTLADVTGQYIRNSTINQSTQRGIVIHGTNGTEVKNNVVYDVRGHGIFTEDASERRTIIDGNLVLKVRNIPMDKHLKLHETGISRVGSSGFWISNPDNTITNNTASDCEGSGFWLAFPEKPFGASTEVPLAPINMKFGTFDKNHAHSNQQEGIFLDHGETDDDGTTSPRQYFPTSDMQPPQNDRGMEFDNVLPFELTDYWVWKNNVSGFWDSAGLPRNRRAVSADNTERFFAGQTDTRYPGLIEKSLVVGTSLNHNMNGVTMPTSYGAGPRSAFASYHSSFDIKDNVIVNFEAVPGKNSGAFALSDYYIAPVDKGTVRNPNNILIKSHPGVRTMAYVPHFVLAVLWDHHDYWGGPKSEDNYYVFNTPYFTYGQTPRIVPPDRGPEVAGGVIVEGPFYGFSTFRVNSIDRSLNKIVATRINAAGATVGTWAVEETPPGGLFGMMRHFATHPTGYYHLEWPNIDDINDFTIAVENMLTGNDYQVLSVEYSGNYNITEVSAANRIYTPVSNFQAVVNAPTGEVFWQDKSNNRVWMKIRGGVNPGDPTYATDHDVNLYKIFDIHASGTYDPLNATPTKQDQTITFAQLSNKQTTDAAFTLSASTGSGLPVSFSLVSGPATLSGNTLTLNGTVGTVTVRASQAGNASFNAAPAIERSFQVNTPSSPTKQDQTITFAPLPNKQTTEGSFTLSARSSSNLPVSFSLVSGPATLSGNTLILSTAGTVTVRANQGGDANYNAAANVERSFQVSAPGTPPPTKQDQTITFAQLSNKQTTDAAFTLSASTGSGLPVSFSLVSGPATLSGNTLTLSGTVGTVTVRASQGGDANYNAAANVERSFQVSAPGTPPPTTPEPTALKPRNIFSPNGDGSNEVWQIEGIEQHPEVEVAIFNNNGQQLLINRPYQNNWDGTYQRMALPEGVYYFTLRQDGKKILTTGAITLIR